MEELIERAEEKGIDVEELILSALSRVDLKESIKLIIELAEKYMAEAFKYLDKGDAVQASEKAYKAAEGGLRSFQRSLNYMSTSKPLRRVGGIFIRSVRLQVLYQPS
jgi:hypothetical protein